MNAVISETKKAAILGLGMQILGISAQCKFDSAGHHALLMYVNVFEKWK